MIVLAVPDWAIRSMISAAFSWCDDINFLARMNCSNGIESPWRLIRCWYSDESISSTSLTANIMCKSM